MEPNSPPPPGAPPPAASGGPRPTLTRSATDRILTGVAGGVGEYFRIDPVLVRIGFVVATIAGGWGVILYLAAWLMLPEANGAPALGRRLLDNRGVWWVIVVVLGLVVGIPLLIGLIGLVFGVGSLSIGLGGWAGPLIVVAILLVLTGGGTGHRDAAVRSPTQPSGVRTGEDAEPSEPWTRRPVALAPPWGHRRPGPSITRIVLGLLVVLSGFLWIAIEEGADPSVTGVMATALLIVGLGLLVGSRIGRARGLVPVGVMLTVLLVGSTSADITLGGGVGERFHAPVTVDELIAGSPFRLLAGEQTVDLADLALSPGDDVRVRVEQGAGQLLVVVPIDANVVIDAHVGAGELSLPDGTTDDGIGLDRVVQWGPADEGVPKLYVEIDMGAGEVVIAAGSDSQTADATHADAPQNTATTEIDTTGSDDPVTQGAEVLR